MTDARTEDWVYIIKPNGEVRIASPEYVRDLLKIQGDKTAVYEKLLEQNREFYSLCQVLRGLVAPSVAEAVKAKMRGCKGKRASDIVKLMDAKFPLSLFVYDAVDLLVKGGSMTVKHGWYKLKEAEA